MLERGRGELGGCVPKGRGLGGKTEQGKTESMAKIKSKKETNTMTNLTAQ